MDCLANQKRSDKERSDFIAQESYAPSGPREGRRGRASEPPWRGKVAEAGWHWIGVPLRYDVHFHFSRARSCVEFRIAILEKGDAPGSAETGATDDPSGWQVRLDLESVRRAIAAIEQALLQPRDVIATEFSYAQRLRTQQFFSLWRGWSKEMEQSGDEDTCLAFHLRQWEIRDGMRALVFIRSAFASRPTTTQSAMVRAPAAHAHRLLYHRLRHTTSGQIHCVDLCTSDPVTGVVTSAWGGGGQIDMNRLPSLRIHIRREGRGEAVSSTLDPWSEGSTVVAGGCPMMMDEWQEGLDGPLLKACSLQ